MLEIITSESQPLELIVSPPVAPGASTLDRLLERVVYMHFFYLSIHCNH